MEPPETASQAQTISNSHEKHFSPRWMMLISVLAVSSGAVLVRYAQQEAPSLMIAAWRLTIGTLVMAPSALLHHRQALRQMTLREWALVILSGILLALHFGTWISSLEYTTVSSSVVLVSMSPLLVALISTFILKEPLSRLAWAGMAIALAGSAVVAFGGQWTGASAAGEPGIYPNRLLGNILAFSGAVFVAGYLAIGRKLRSQMALPPYALTVFGTAAVALMAAALLSGQKITGYSPVTYLYFILLGLVPQTLGHAGFNWALKYLPAAFVSIALLGEPIGSSIFAMLLLGEPPALFEIIGGLLILAGIYLAANPWKNRSASAPK